MNIYIYSNAPFYLPRSNTKSKNWGKSATTLPLEWGFLLKKEKKIQTNINPPNKSIELPMILCDNPQTEGKTNILSYNFECVIFMFCLNKLLLLYLFF